MEGRALDREPWQSTAWFVAYSSFVAVSLVDVEGAASRPWWLVAGLAGGFAWQWLYRRDLVSRLTMPAALVALGLAGAMVTGTSIRWEDMDTAGLWIIGALIGLVACEQVQRQLDLHRVAREHEIPSVGDPTR